MYPDLDFSSYLTTWLAKNKIFVKEFSEIVKFTNEKSQQYVKVKDLVEGMVYTTASSFDEDYVYLGKDNEGYYLWMFIGNHEVFSSDPYRYINVWATTVDRLKTMKKLRGVSKRYPTLRVDISLTKYRLR